MIPLRLVPGILLSQRRIVLGETHIRNACSFEVFECVPDKGNSIALKQGIGLPSRWCMRMTQCRQFCISGSRMSGSHVIFHRLHLEVLG